MVQQRAGHVTASRLKAAVCTNYTQPEKSKAICYPNSTQRPHVGGVSMKKTIRDHATDKHVFQKADSNQSSIPLHGCVSPDGVIKCNCYGYGLLEIMCPYSCRDKL